MTSHFADRLTHACQSRSPICVGIDPVIDKLPAGIPKTLDGMRDFCLGIVDAVQDIAAAVKPNLAFFERYGWEGMRVCEEVATAATKRGLLVIADGKRGDIGSTCEAYAEAYLGASTPFDALTVHPYHGADGIEPFAALAEKNGKGIFILVKTSNESAGDIQDLPVGDESLAEHLAQLVESWAMHRLGRSNISCIGAVVGATYPEDMKYLRTLMPHVPFLIPGYGAQGGTADDVRWGFLPDGTGAIVTASRSILYASTGTDWATAAAQAASDMATTLRATLRRP